MRSLDPSRIRCSPDGTSLRDKAPARPVVDQRTQQRRPSSLHPEAGQRTQPRTERVQRPGSESRQKTRPLTEDEIDAKVQAFGEYDPTWI